MRKLKFFMIGMIPGLLLVFFILNKKGASCSGYLPNSRVIAESLSKKPVYSADFLKSMRESNITEDFVKDSIMVNGNIDFGQSEAQKQPCPTYVLQYPKKNPRFEISFQKCSETTTYQTFKNIH